MQKPDIYCSYCGTPLGAAYVDGRDRPRCPACGKVVYYSPKLAVAVIVAQNGGILFVKRDIEPGQGLWSFPSGYVDRGEVVEDAAVREVEEETGLKVRLDGLVGLYSRPGDPVVLAVYAGRMDGGEVAAGAEVTDVAFFPASQLPPLAFPHDEGIIRDWQSGGMGQRKV